MTDEHSSTVTSADRCDRRQPVESVGARGASLPAAQHLTIYDYVEATRHVTTKVHVTAGIDWQRPLLLRWWPAAAWKALRLLLHHSMLVVLGIRYRDHDLILVQSFNTLYLAAFAPLLWPFRHKMLLTMHHNLQFAHRRRHEKLILKGLFAAGFRFAVQEARDGVAELGIHASDRQILVLRPPVHDTRPVSIRDCSGRATVGIIGELRSEKRTHDLIALLVEARRQGRLAAELVLGCSDPRQLASWSGAGIKLVDTAAYEDYLAALASCDVIALNYEASSYYYRHSGVISDAAGVGTAVVCPDYPTLRRQVSEPVPVGYVFRTPEELVPAIRRALELRAGSPENFQRWTWARSPQEFSRRLDEFVRSAQGAEA
jgi:glycosyltransferase involved in cell wall biosynthesis